MSARPGVWVPWSRGADGRWYEAKRSGDYATIKAETDMISSRSGTVFVLVPAGRHPDTYQEES